MAPVDILTLLDMYAKTCIYSCRVIHKYICIHTQRLKRSDYKADQVTCEQIVHKNIPIKGCEVTA